MVQELQKLHVTFFNNNTIMRQIKKHKFTVYFFNKYFLYILCKSLGFLFPGAFLKLKIFCNCVVSTF